MKKSLAETQMENKWEICEAYYKKHCNIGMCDPLIYVMWKGTDVDGTAFLSYFESFFSFEMDDKKEYYRGLLQMMNDPNYKETEENGVKIANKVELPKSIDLRMKKFQKQKKNKKKKLDKN